MFYGNFAYILDDCSVGLSIMCSAVDFLVAQTHENDRLSRLIHFKCTLRKYTREWGSNNEKI